MWGYLEKEGLNCLHLKTGQWKDRHGGSLEILVILYFDQDIKLMRHAFGITHSSDLHTPYQNMSLPTCFLMPHAWMP